MKPLIVVLMVLVTIAICTQPPSNNFAPPPTITPNTLFTMPFSNVSEIVKSERLQGMQFVRSGGKTDIKISLFNRSQTSKFKVYTLANLTGNWQQHKTNPRSLSCFSIYETSDNRVQLIKFDQRTNTFQSVFTVTQSQYRALIPPASASATLTQIVSNFIIADTCRLISFYSKVYRLTQTGPQLVVGTDSPTWVIKSHADSLNYVVVGHSLYKYNMQTRTYAQVRSLAPSSNYIMMGFQNRVFVESANATQRNNTNVAIALPDGTLQVQSNVVITQINAKFQFFVDSPSGFTQLHQFSLNGFQASPISNTLPFIVPTLSQDLTKLGFRYIKFNAANSTQLMAGQIVIKSFDYTRMTTTNMRFANPQRFFSIMQGIQSGNDIYLSDFFFVARNQGVCVQDSSKTCIERVYQFVGNQLIEIGQRNLTNPNQITNFEKVFVDQSFTVNAIILVALKSAAGTSYEVIQINYYNYAAITRIVVPPPPSFFSQAFQLPLIPSLDGPNLQMTTSMFSDPTTLVKKYRFTKTYNPSSSNVIVHNITLPGNYQQIASNVKCSIHAKLDSSNNVQGLLFLQYVTALNTFVPSALIAPEISTLGISLTPSLSVQIANSCDRVAVNNLYVFYRESQRQWNLANNNFTQLAWTAIDEDLKYAVTTNSIWKFNPSLNKFVLYYTHNGTFYSSKRVSSFGNRFSMVSHQNSPNSVKNVSAFAFLDSPTGLKLVFEYHNSYIGDYVVEISDSLQLVAFAGMRPSAANPQVPYLDIVMKSLNYDTLTSIDLQFPKNAIRQGQTTVPNVLLFDRFAYVRQLKDASQLSNTTYAALVYKEFVYLYDQGNVPKLIFSRDLSNSPTSNWIRTMFKKYPDKTLLLQVYAAVNSSHTQYTLKNYQINVQKASVNLDGGFVQNGKVKSCILGCTSCTNENQCKQCGKIGFVLNTVTNRCVQCAPGCSACEPDRPNVCSTCLNGTYFDGVSSCLRCMSPCLTCSSPTVCTTCPPGRFLNSANSCQNCTLRNCERCSASACLSCRSGFILTSTSTCRGCAKSCSTCDPADITKCTGCRNGLKLVNGACVSCPLNCITCNHQIQCQICQDGFYAKDGKCVVECMKPCATCSDSNPSVCLSCFGNDRLEGSTCKFQATCNSTNNCTSCGETQGSNLYLVQNNCYSCNDNGVISNCVQCNSQNPLVCAICKLGFYQQMGECKACDSNCLQCISSTVCQACASGYALMDGAKSGLCFACQSPCETCDDSPTSCLTCVSGYTKQAWKCQKNNFVQFKLVLSTSTVASVLAKIDDIVRDLLTMMGQNSNNVDAITIYSVVTGSIQLEGSATSTSGTAAQTQTALSSGLTGASTIGGLSLGSSSITTVDLGRTQTSPANNVGLIVGVTIGSIVAVGAIVAVLVYFLYYKKKLLSQVAQVENSNNQISIVQQKNVERPNKMQVLQ